MTSIPFQENAPLENIIRSEQINDGLARLDYLTSQGVAALMHAASGLGKSTLLRLYQEALIKKQINSVYVFLTQVSASSLLSLIVNAMGEKVGAINKDKLFLQIFEKVKKSQSTTILIIDEAHLLNTEMLTDLRLLVSSPLESGRELKIVLSGQEPLKKLLKQDALKDLAGRVSVKISLRPLTKSQSESYINYQVEKSGADKNLFDSEVKSEIFNYSQGVPREINKIATSCLLTAAIKNNKIIDLKLFSHAISEM